MRDIFVSYRRSDSSDVTGRICDHLKARLGEDCLFKDVDSVPLGKDFRSVISEAVGQCAVLLAVIGRDWLDATDDSGRRRIDDASDYVHIEIAAALSRGIPVIPILVENSAMPRAADLPEPIRELAYRNGTPVRADPDFRHDMDRLCAQLEAYVKRGEARPPRPQRRKLAVLVALGLSGVAVMAGGLIATGKLQVFQRNSPTTLVSELQAPIRFWIAQLPSAHGLDAAKLFNNALGSWQAVVDTPISKADSEATANVVISVASDTYADAQLGPPKPGSAPLRIRFGSSVAWTSRTFEAASARMLGHILGLTYTQTPGQLMTQEVSLETLPLTPQSEDIARVREIWRYDSAGKSR